MQQMRKFLVVGLGNPGKKYQRTRHNVGRLVVDWLKKDAEIGEWVEFFTPQTFMNQSGAPVFLELKKQGIEPKNLVVIHDDVDIKVGEYKIQKNRSSAGHKGVQSIIDALASQDFWRVRIGVGRPVSPSQGRPPQGTETESYVLKPLPSLVYTKLSKQVASERFKSELRKIYGKEQRWDSRKK